MNWIRLAAEEGEETAQYYMGEIYRLGLGVSKDFNEALKWLKLAAERKNLMRKPH